MPIIVDTYKELIININTNTISKNYNKISTKISNFANIFYAPVINQLRILLVLFLYYVRFHIFKISNNTPHNQKFPIPFLNKIVWITI